MNPKIEINIAGLKLKNPLVAASGTYGFGIEPSQFTEVSHYGAIITKSITPNPRLGNPPPRITETPSGMINTIGLENPGLDKFISEISPKFEALNVPIIVSIAGESLNEFEFLAKNISTLAQSVPSIKAIEVNTSCPNLSKQGQTFSQSEDILAPLVNAVKKTSTMPIFVKLSPNVTHIDKLAKTAVKEGADGLSIANTYLGMSVNWRLHKSNISKMMGGISGPAIKPLSLAAVYRVKQVTNVPVFGIGGITSAEDVLEYMTVGANAVQIGVGNFLSPNFPKFITDEIYKLLTEQNISDINNIVGSIT